MEKIWKLWQISFSWAPKSLWMVTVNTKLKDACSLGKKKNKLYDKHRQCIKKQRHHFADKGSYSQSYGFSSSHVWMWELDYKGSWGLKNWCFRTVALEKTLKSPLDSKNIKPVNPKGNQPLIFIGRSGAEAEALILWPLGAKSQLVGKDPDDGKDWGQEEKWVIEDEMVTWTDWLSGLELIKLREIVKVRNAWHAAVHGSQSVRHDLETEQ